MGARTVVRPDPQGVDALVEVGQALQEAGIAVDDLSLRQPTLDEVFLDPDRVRPRRRRRATAPA